MSNMKCVELSPSGWLAGTASLKAVEKGIYINLIMKMYEMGGFLNDDADHLARVCGMSKGTFIKALDVLIDEGLIFISDGALTNPRADVVRESTGQEG